MHSKVREDVEEEKGRVVDEEGKKCTLHRRENDISVKDKYGFLSVKLLTRTKPPNTHTHTLTHIHTQINKHKSPVGGLMAKNCIEQQCLCVCGCVCVCVYVFFVMTYLCP